MSNADVIIADRIIARRSFSGTNESITDIKESVDSVIADVNTIATNAANISALKAPTMTHSEAISVTSAPLGKIIFVTDPLEVEYSVLCYWNGSTYMKTQNTVPLGSSPPPQPGPGPF